MSFLRASHCASRLGRQGSHRAFATSARHLAEEVRIVEVGPRDGLQNEKNTVPLKTKLELIGRLAKTGVRDIEAGAFVAPKWVPQVCPSQRPERYHPALTKLTLLYDDLDGKFCRSFKLHPGAASTNAISHCIQLPCAESKRVGELHKGVW